MGYQIERFPYDGAVDADGHVLEPATLWEDYLEARYRDRAIRIRVDENGLEYLELDGRPSSRTVKGVLGLMGAMGDTGARPSPDRRYMDNIPYGAGDPHERVALLDKEHLERAFLYPTIGLLWECEVTDPELTVALQRAYNRWVAEFCRDSGGRLVPIAHLSLVDVDAAVDELGRAVADGCLGAFVAPFTHSRRPHGHPDHDALWARASDLDVPIAIHPTFEPDAVLPPRFSFTGWGREAQWYLNVLVRQGVQQAFLSFFALGTLERFPRIRLGVLESGSGWIGSFLDRMDAVYETNLGRFLSLTMPPSEYFRRQCFISGDPDETTAPLIMEHVGAESFMWATDYPHPDHPSTWVHALTRLVEPLPPEVRTNVLGANVNRIYGVTR
jgi:predicted TIM-barrel fold metal-dependent hydrolase